MGVEPARDYGQSHSGPAGIRGGADVISLPRRRPSPYRRPEENREETPQTTTTQATPESARKTTDSHRRLRVDTDAIANTANRIREATHTDLASIVAVWADPPEPLRSLVDRIAACREDPEPVEIGRAIWAFIALAPRAGLHLLSWILSSFTRTAVTIVAALIIYLTA